MRLAWASTRHIGWCRHPMAQLCKRGSDSDELIALVNGGLEVGSAIMPKVRPQNIDQLSLFDVGIG